MKSRPTPPTTQFDATTDQIRGAQLYLALIAKVTDQEVGSHDPTFASFWDAFPELKNAVDSLPEVEPTMALAPELKRIIVEALEKFGVIVQPELRARLGV